LGKGEGKLKGGELELRAADRELFPQRILNIEITKH